MKTTRKHSTKTKGQFIRTPPQERKKKTMKKKGEKLREGWKNPIKSIITLEGRILVYEIIRDGIPVLLS